MHLRSFTLVSLLVAAARHVEARHHARRQVTADPSRLDGQTFDYVIVGGGTAGLVLAHRLSSDSATTVAVIEGGNDGTAVDFKDRLSAPGLAYLQGLTGTEYDWQFLTTNQTGLNGRSIRWPRGKTLGGSSATNGLYLIHASQSEHDGWATLVGNDSWSGARMAAGIRKSERWTAMSTQDAADLTFAQDASAHGVAGPIHYSSPPPVYREQLAAWIPSMAAVGIPSRDPATGLTADAFLATAAIDPQGYRRSSSKTGYLDPVSERTNLVVLTSVTATRILFADKVATGVRYAAAAGAPSYAVNARKEVVLCAGTVGSPHLLLVSGVGPRAALQSAQVDLVQDLPGVGQHLHEHISSSIAYDVTGHVTLTGDQVNADPAFAAAQLALWQAGDAASIYSASNNAVAFLNLTTLLGDTTTTFLASAKAGITAYAETHIDDPTVRAGYLAVSNAEIDRMLPSNVGAVEVLLANHGTYGRFGQEMQTMSIQASLQRSFSRGLLTVSSGNILDAPIIDPRYLSHDGDIQILREAFKFVRRLAATPPLAALINSELSPGNETISDEAMDAWLRSSVGTSYSPTGTCSMLPLDLGGVVDPQLRVHGLRNLRVVDASVFPVPLAAHACAPTYALAEVAADIILSESGASSATTDTNSATAPSTTQSEGNKSGAMRLPAAGSAVSVVLPALISILTCSL